ncbi:unnamed protein product [Effrenium voratum]|nr:unnamed protein product [Effrenium voratum]
MSRPKKKEAEDFSGAILSKLTEEFAQRSAGEEFANDVTILFCGPKKSGKTSIVDRFINPTKDEKDQPKPTVALDYKFARYATDGSSSKVLAHIYDLGGDEANENLINVPISTSTVGNMVLAITLDLSEPHSCIQNLEKWLQLLRSQVDKSLQALAQENPQGMLQLEAQRALRANSYAEHADRGLINLFPVPVVIFGPALSWGLGFRTVVMISVVDMAAMADGREGQLRVAQALSKAFADTGPGPWIALAQLRRSAMDFFHQPLAEKQMVNEGSAPGYGSSPYCRLEENGAQLLGDFTKPDDLVESLTCPMEGLERLPDRPPELRPAVQDFGERVARFREVLNCACDLALGQDEGFFASKCGKGREALRLAFYPDLEAFKRFHSDERSVKQLGFDSFERGPWALAESSYTTCFCFRKHA